MEFVFPQENNTPRCLSLVWTWFPRFSGFKKKFMAKHTDGEKSVTAKISDANFCTMLQSSLIKFEDIINVAMVMIFRHELNSVDCKGHVIRGYIML